MELYNGQLKKIKYNKYTKRSYTKKNGNKSTIYSDDILTFDIEVSSAWLRNGKVIKYKVGKDSDYWNSLEPLCISYLWQFSFNDKVYYGRELRDFEQVLKDIPPKVNVIIWVHNLAYEFHFLINFLKWKTVFARTPHKPMKAIPLDYPNVEFRCSYVLTRLSLRTWGMEIGTYKDNPIDYEELRTPLTPLTDEELHYGEQDCIVVYKGIQKYLKEYGHLRDIPLTQTGTVRKVVKELLTSDAKYVRNIKRLVPNDAEEYKMLMDIFAGGYTHANKKYAGSVQRGYIEHYDFASSYPTVMVAEKYPMTPWVDESYRDKFPGDEEFEDKAFIFDLEFTNIRCETNNTYIQFSKSTCIDYILDNGRVVKAKKLRTKMTEQDYLTVKETYSWKKMKVHSIYSSKKKYLPKEFVKYILELYKNKTELKDVKGKEDLYGQSKQYINSMYGMCVTAILQADVKFDGEEWTIAELTEDEINKKLRKLSSWYPREKRYFLSYSWGCWVTAYARRNLWRCVISCDSDVLYCDTDSIFVLGKNDFSWYNEDVTNKLKVACSTQKLNFEMTRPKTKKGKEKPLGIFAPEDSCSEFISLGAKRYVERRIEDNKLHLTVSGINKSAVVLLNDDITNFKDGFNFDKDAECVKKQLSTYVTQMPVVKYPDGYVSTYTKGINLRRNGYLLTMTDEYKQILDMFNINLQNMSEEGINNLRKLF